MGVNKVRLDCAREKLEDLGKGNSCMDHSEFFPESTPLHPLFLLPGGANSSKAGLYSPSGGQAIENMKTQSL